MATADNGSELAVTHGLLCVFCNEGEDERILGELLTSEGVAAHHFCLLFSSGLAQRGEDDEGLLGFLLADINKEKRRSNRISCAFCKKKGASIGCSIQKCKKSFHYGCGKEGKAIYMHFGNFESYCSDHRPSQPDLPADERLRLKTKPTEDCYICYTTLTTQISHDVILAPCCTRAWYHRSCLEEMAYSAGVHFFKCPLCNNIDEWQAEMLQYGIFIPDRDASWELEPDAYNSLLEQRVECEAKKCVCKGGRASDQIGTDWELILCETCGSSATHTKCSSLRKKDKEWLCKMCSKYPPSSATTATPSTPAAAANISVEVENSTPVGADGSPDIVGSPGPVRGRKRRQVSTPKQSRGRTGHSRKVGIHEVTNMMLNNSLQ